MQRTCQARACASQSRGCTHVGAGARQDIARARGGGRGSGLAALPRPSQCRPEKGRLIFQNRDAMGGAAPRPSTRTMVLCTVTRGSRVRCVPFSALSRAPLPLSGLPVRTKLVPRTIDDFACAHGPTLSKTTSCAQPQSYCAGGRGLCARLRSAAYVSCSHSRDRRGSARQTLRAACPAAAGRSDGRTRRRPAMRRGPALFLTCLLPRPRSCAPHHVAVSRRSNWW